MLNNLKAEYNNVLKRIKKAEIYFDGPAPDEEKDKHEDAFKELLKRADELLEQISDMQQLNISTEEILTGFKY